MGLCLLVRSFWDADTKAGEMPFIEGEKDKTAEGITKMVADEKGLLLPT